MAPKNKWHNKTMNSNLQRMHPEQMQEVVEARVTTSERKRDKRDESARGCIPVFNLQNRYDDIPMKLIYLNRLECS